MNQFAESKFDATTELILDAAWERLSHYGLSKTTMAEIASDCGMSAANLYRYFANKNEIASACCMRAIMQARGSLEDIVRSKELTATEKLKKYALTMVEMNHERAAGKSKIGELVANMTENNSDIIQKKVAWHHSLIAEILAQGNASAEFAVSDVLDAAEKIYTSMVVFDVPLFVGLFPLDQYRVMSEELVDFLIRGIGAR